MRPAGIRMVSRSLPGPVDQGTRDAGTRRLQGTPMDDRQLVAGLLGGNREAALAECIRRYGPMVKRSAWRITGDEHSAEDVCQAVFMVLVRKAASLTTVNLLGAWLYRVTVAAARDAIKSQGRRQRREQESVMVAQAQSKPATTLLKRLDDAVNRLPDKYRQVIVAHYFEGRTYAEVAAGLGVAEETVKKRGGRGVDRLRELLARMAGSAPLAAASIAAIQASAISMAPSQAAVLAKGAMNAMFWAKAKVYASIVAAAATVTAVPAYILLKPTDAGLVGHYAFTEGSGTTVKDASPSGNHGTLVGGVSWKAGHKPGSKALSFDGKTGHVKLSQDLSQWLGGTATVAFWISTTQKGVPSDGFAVPGCVTGVDVPGIDPVITTNDIQWGFVDEAGRTGVSVGDLALGRTKQLEDIVLRSKQAINDGQWHHVALTRDATSGRVEVFVDGKVSGARTAGTGPRTTPFFSIGRKEVPEQQKPAHYFQGLLAEVRFYNRVLTPEEIATLAK
jgi:RNA polymerase sigma factor (sigma-70 family)